MRNLLLLIVLILLSNCTTENDDNSMNTNAKFVKKIITIETGTEYEQNYKDIVTSTFNYVPNKGNLSSINFKKESINGYVTEYDINFYYTDNKLANVTYGVIPSTMKFNYTDGRLSTIDYLNIRGYSNQTAKFTLNYNSNNQVSEIICDYPYYKATNIFTYDGNTINRIIVKKDNSIKYTYDLDYDDKFNAFKNISFEEKIFLMLYADGYGYVYPYLDFVGSFVGEHNIKSFEGANFNNSYDADGYIKESSFSYDTTKGATQSITTYEY